MNGDYSTLPFKGHVLADFDLRRKVLHERSTHSLQYRYSIQSARKPNGPYPVASQTVLYKYSDEDLITRVVSLK